jgi:NAD(P)-dependent dehydrogenase (short-subunit alcohol dehydrogenase family)
MAKPILLVGGNSGIGAALAERLRARGAELITAHRSGTPSFDATAENPDFPDPGGPLGGLVYLPGSINLKPFQSLKPADFEEDFRINVLGAVKTLQHYQKALKEAGDASVLLFSTVAVGTGMPFHASVASAKGAVEGLVRSLAAEWAPKVRVNAIAPSLTDTPLATRLLRNDKQREAGDQRHPMQRIGQPEDVANLADFLLNPANGWITGQVWNADGGMGAVRVG